jgi:pyruvate/2-oxoglutarate dehydrogenase complex dihydrolipoamide dehydrogenase (E3) component
MLASAAVAHQVRHASEYGVEVGAPEINLLRVHERTRSIVASFRTKNREHLESLEGLDLIFGEAAFAEPHTLCIESEGREPRTIQAETLVIDTGSHPMIPPIEGIDTVATWDSTSILEIKEIPEHLAVLGGGPVGVEFAQMFRRFGAAVTIIEQAPLLLPHEDEDIADEMGSILADEGIAIRTGFAAKYLEMVDRKIRILGAEGDRGLCVLCSDVLIAAGRAPETQSLELERAGVATGERGEVLVDERLGSSVAGIYAIGDVNGSDPFTHISYDDYRILRANLLDGGDRSTNDRILSYVIFTDPQLGRVGASEQALQSQGIAYRRASMPMSHIARALETARPQGMVKALVSVDDDRILGAAILGAEGGELMSMIQIAMIEGLPYSALRNGVFAHPTYAEGLNSLFDSLESVPSRTTSDATGVAQQRP